MGRQPNAPQATPNGTYKCWHPGLKKYVNLGTSDFAAACSIQAGFYGAKSRHEVVPRPAAQANPSPVGNPTFPYAAGGGGSDRGLVGNGMIDFDKADDPLSGWLNKDKNDGPSSVATTTPNAQPTTSMGVPGPGLSFLPVQSKSAQGNKAKPGLTPEQAAKLASGLKKTVANLNIIIVGASVQLFGRVPAQLDDEEVALLQMGWEMYIDEMFAKAKIKPWHLLLAGNVMIAAAMYVGGTPIPRKPTLPANDPSKAKSATVTPIGDGSKPNV